MSDNFFIIARAPRGVWALLILGQTHKALPSSWSKLLAGAPGYRTLSPLFTEGEKYVVISRCSFYVKVGVFFPTDIWTCMLRIIKMDIHVHLLGFEKDTNNHKKRKMSILEIQVF